MIITTFSIGKCEVLPKELIELYTALGWGQKSDYDEATVLKAITNTSYTVTVRNTDGKLIGMARILSDDMFHTHIAEVILHPNYRRRGIGTEIMKCVEQRYGHTSIYLDTFKGSEPFFIELGYTKRDMIVFSKRTSL